MINHYLVPCRFCGGTVQPNSGTVEQVGQSWRGAHLFCAEENRRSLMMLMGAANPYPAASHVCSPARSKVR